jgi:hypothetical protein
VTALDGFYTTWNNARETFGQGTPQPGTDFDNSSQLRDLGDNVDNAKPGGWWSGAAASSYEKANDDHKQVFGRLADLDRKLSEKVNQSAQVVANGRENLDAVKQWVTDAANSVPPGKQRDMMLMQISNKGLGQLTDVVKTSNDELTGVGNGIRTLKGEYDEAGNQKHAKEDGEGEPEGVTDDEKKRQEELERRAEEDVKKTLEEGDQQAASRVNDALTNIVPGQDLKPEQKAYLDQMASQQQNMTVNELKDAQDRLGDRKNVIGDSWQLMSNDDVKFGDADENGNLRPGSFDRLPESVQKAISISNLDYPAGEVERQQIEEVADIVRNGDTKFQDGTELDREMIRLSDRLMDQSPVNQETVRDLFTSAGRDHQVVTDHMVDHQPYLNDPNAPGTVPYDYNSDDFLNDIATMGWADDGKDAASLFSWTNEEAGTNPDIASAAAERYAQFLGTHPELTDIPNAFGQTDTLGQLNPELVKGMAHGLTPYMADIANVEGGADDNFNPLDSGQDSQNRPIAKGVFSVLGTQVDAYREFYGAANELALEKSYDWANKVKEGDIVYAHDASMNGAATLKALMDYGTADGLKTIGMDNQEMEDLKKSVYNQAVDKLSMVPGPYGKAMGFLGGALEDSFFGNGSDINGDVVPMYADESGRFAANALLAAGVDMPGINQYVTEDVNANGEPYRRLMTWDEMEAKGLSPTPDTLGGDLNQAVDQALGPNSKSPTEAFGAHYDRITQS